MDYQPLLFGTYSVLPFSQKLDAVLRHGWAFSWRIIVQDWMHSCAAASIMDTATMTFQ